MTHTRMTSGWLRVVAWLGRASAEGGALVTIGALTMGVRAVRVVLDAFRVQLETLHDEWATLRADVRDAREEVARALGVERRPAAQAMPAGRVDTRALPRALVEALARTTRGEEVLWMGAPHAGDALRHNWEKGALGVFWLAMVGGMCALGLRDVIATGDITKLWGLLFVLPHLWIGLMMAGAPLGAHWMADRTVYVVTTRRVLILRQRWRVAVLALEAGAVNTFERRSDGTTCGSIIFRRTVEQKGRSSRAHEVGFLHIRSIPDAEAALCTMMAHNRYLERWNVSYGLPADAPASRDADAGRGAPAMGAMTPQVLER